MRITNKYVFFYGGIYSNWYPCTINCFGRTFNCAEQAMMYMKAIYFMDVETAERIMKTTHPSRQKALGRKVKNFNKKDWDQVCIGIVTEILYHKFIQNEDLKALLMLHGNKRWFVEASPYDDVWGIGMGQDDKGVEDPKNWKGKNYLGICLDNVYGLIFSGDFNYFS